MPLCFSSWLSRVWAFFACFFRELSYCAISAFSSSVISAFFVAEVWMKSYSMISLSWWHFVRWTRHSFTQESRSLNLKFARCTNSLTCFSTLEFMPSWSRAFLSDSCTSRTIFSILALVKLSPWSLVSSLPIVVLVCGMLCSLLCWVPPELVGPCKFYGIKPATLTISSLNSALISLIAVLLYF